MLSARSPARSVLFDGVSVGPEKGRFRCLVGNGPTAPPRGDFYVVKRAGKRTCRPERVVSLAVGGGGTGTGVGAGVGGGVVCAGEFDVGLPWPDSSNMYAGLTRSADTVTGLPRTRG
jgi:hypothetical protein